MGTVFAEGIFCAFAAMAILSAEELHGVNLPNGSRIMRNTLMQTIV